jgi:Phage integrase family
MPACGLGSYALDRMQMQECRHTFASLMIAAGVSAKALSIFMGHSSITITMDRYGHLMPGSEDEAAGLLDAYLDACEARVESGAASPKIRLGAPIRGRDAAGTHG